ncbi:MAG: hypothetical protein ACREJD_12985 [Phycisphaerales bacterium]
MILYLAADLIWASKIKATADSLGLACRPVRTLEMLEARLADSDVRALILDLDVAEMAMTMLARVKREQQSARTADQQIEALRVTGTARKICVVAFGPHVAREELRAAREAGADEVLTRGAFDHNMDQVLLRLAGGVGGVKA